MKFFLLVCILGFAAAEFLEEAAPLVEQSVAAFLDGADRTNSLPEAFGITDPQLDQLTEDVESEVTRKIREALREILDKIRDSVDQGKVVAQELLEKVKQLRQKIKELGGENNEKTKEILKKIREKAKEALRRILKKLGRGRRNLDDSMDHVARMRFRELVDRIKEKLLSNETTEKIREYLSNYMGKSEVVQNLKELASHLEDVDIKEIVRHLLEYRPEQGQKRAVAVRAETWEKVKMFFKDRNFEIQNRNKKFGQWVKEKWTNGLDKMQEKYGAIKAISMQFITDSKDISSKMAGEALEFFRPYKEDLGSLWKQIVEASKEAIGKF